MGSSVSHLTEYDLDEVIRHCGGKFNRSEVLALYRRFRQLDKGAKGYVSSDELLNVPELSLNPLAKRISHLFENVNFIEFVALLGNFSTKATREEKLRFLFQVFDVDGDDLISREDLEHMCRTLCGASLTEDELAGLVKRVLFETCPDEDTDQISFKAFASLFNDTVEELVLKVVVPQYD